MQQKLRYPVLMILGVVGVAMGFAVSAALSEEVTGVPRVIDGDTVQVGEVTIRLHGIDALEDDQTCLIDNEGDEPIEFACGPIPGIVLVSLIDGNEITCNGDERDRYDRLIATCYLGEMNLGAWMVKSGFAVAYLKYSTDYAPEQWSASNFRVGLMATEFERPEYFRRGDRQ